MEALLSNLLWIFQQQLTVLPHYSCLSESTVQAHKQLQKADDLPAFTFFTPEQVLILLPFQYYHCLHTYYSLLSIEMLRNSLNDGPLQNKQKLKKIKDNSSYQLSLLCMIKIFQRSLINNRHWALTPECTWSWTLRIIVPKNEEILCKFWVPFSYKLLLKFLPVYYTALCISIKCPKS